MEELRQIPYDENIRLASFDVKNIYTNIPTSELPNILKLLCTQHGLSTTFTHELTKLTCLLLKQNYFSFQDNIFLQIQGLAMGEPTSSIFSELFLLYMKHTTLYDILIHHHIFGYFRYVDDILILYDASLTEIDAALTRFNTATSPLQFIIEKVLKQHINFLDITIYRDTYHFTYGIYRKPKTTDSIIPSSFCYPRVHKYSAIRYVHNRLITYPISEQHRLQEEQVIAHILHQNNYPPISPSSLEHKSQYKITDTTKQTHHKWAILTYSGKETRFVTKILKKTGLHFAFTTRQNIGKLLAYKTDRPSDKCEDSGVYQLTCLDCQKCYVGQTDILFHTRFKEHTHRITELETIDPILQNISQTIVMLGILSKIIYRTFMFLLKDECLTPWKGFTSIKKAKFKTK
jgi:hypothetical protein